eukprot:TRINITY_DN8453_c0_g1_i1.p1 TRINITY_DN8453_c0_g1~~TRINITY_DN8453_c0_g1_i1.p1  ORF type:complete len:652 (-),score=118.79 TRINITY_DN8453_c0_g1_i1:70-2025(-)
MALDTERNASFDVRQLTYYLNGGEEKTKRKEELTKLFESEPVFRRDDVYFNTRVQNFERSYEKYYALTKFIQKHNITEPWELDVVRYLVGSNPFGLHSVMFVPTIKSLGTDEQQKYWLSQSIVGTYAQTELGHGSFLPGLETIATYDKSTQEFVLHSPHTTSIKWWPGGLGKTATHAVVIARLIIDSKEYGIHSFVVQLRSLEDHKPLPGRTVGDIGRKFGFNLVDNGFLKLDNVRIPREHMLMRYAKVSPDGKFTPPPHDKLVYGTMIYVRVGMVREASHVLSKAIVIALRYSAVRRQGYLEGQKRVGTEQKVLDYTMQQYRLFPLLAAAFALHFTGTYMLELYYSMLEQFKNDDFSLLAETHATSAGLKAFASWLTADGIEECRKACGGHGYLQASGLPLLFADYVPACTYEGDNYLMMQQTARYLLKSVGKAVSKGSLIGNVKYLEGVVAERGVKSTVQTGKDLLDPRIVLKIYEHRAKRLGLDLFEHLSQSSTSSSNGSTAWNHATPDLLRLSRAHCYLTIYKSMVDGVANSPPSIREILSVLRDIFGLYYIERDIADWLEDEYFSPKQVQLLKQEVRRLLTVVRRDAVPLADAFGFTDHYLNSALGRYDGDVYNALFEWTKKEPLNETDVPSGYEKYLKPLLKSNL